MEKTKLIIIRHGETLWNLEHRMQGHMDSDLSPNGYAQVDALSKAFANIHIDILYSSDLPRAVKTASGIEASTGKTAIQLKCLRESNLGILQGKTKEDVHEKYPDNEFDLFWNRNLDFRVPEGESLRERHDRCVSCFEKIIDDNPQKTICIVTHGGVLDSIFRHAHNLPLQTRRTFSISNTGLNIFEIKDGAWTMIVWGDTSHLKQQTVNKDKWR